MASTVKHLMDSIFAVFLLLRDSKQKQIRIIYNLSSSITAGGFRMFTLTYEDLFCMFLEAEQTSQSLWALELAAAGKGTGCFSSLGQISVCLRQDDAL